MTHPFLSCIQTRPLPVILSTLLCLSIGGCSPGPPTRFDPFGALGRGPSGPQPASQEQIQLMEAEIAAGQAPRMATPDLPALRSQIEKTFDIQERTALVHEYLHRVDTLYDEDKPEAMQKLKEALDLHRTELKPRPH